MKKFFLIGILITTIVLFAAFTFVNSAESSVKNLNPSITTNAELPNSAINATATAGAEQFHIQLTAIAEQSR